MEDRIPANPGRVLVTPENGGSAYYATLTRADNPTQEGTPLNKANLLTDATAALFGLDANAVPNDVFSTVRTLIARNATDIANGVKIEAGSYTGTGTKGASYPNSLTFDFVPKVVIIRPDYDASKATSQVPQYIFVWLEGMSVVTSYLGSTAGTSNTNNVVTQNGNTLSWYNAGGSDAAYQFNTAMAYRYVALG